MASDVRSCCSKAKGSAGTEELSIRPLSESDFSKGYMDLLAQLTVVGNVSAEDFTSRFEEIFKAKTSPYLIAVIEHGGKIVASGTLMIEKKFIRGCGYAGHIEDVVVDESMRGLDLGHRIIDFLTSYARDAHCYKVVLDCGEHNVHFYEKCRFSRKGVQMVRYFV